MSITHNLRRARVGCALLLLVPCFMEGRAAARVSLPGTTMVVDDGIDQAPVTHAAALIGMPAAGGGASTLQLGRDQTSHLGSFDIVIVPGPTLAANLPALQAFNRAAQQWEDFIADPIVVTINADLASLATGVLGSASSVSLFADFNTIRNAVAADASDEPDDGIAGMVPTAANFFGFLPAGFGFDGNAQLTKANAKALGFADLDTLFGVSDGDITFSTNVNFDFDNSDGVSTGQFDFESVAAHEIGHALGFNSDVDYVDFVLELGTTAPDVRPTTLDFFRFDDAVANNPTSQADFSAFARSMVPGNVEHFDQVDSSFGGSTEVLFSTGVSQGDGRGASHWKDNLNLGIMDPTLAPGEIAPIRANDVRALDLIGYEIRVPEPSSLALVLMGSVLAFGRTSRKL